MEDGINTLRYSDIFLAMYFNDGLSCLHRWKIHSPLPPSVHFKVIPQIHSKVTP